MKIPELLAPAGNFEMLKAVCSAGADAVYAAGCKYGARAYAENFSEEELILAISYVHLYGKKLYLTLNTLIKDSEFQELYDYLLPLYVKGLDGIIVQDIGVVDFIRNQFPNLPIHISTQAAAMGTDSVEFFKDLGAKRIVLARELSLNEIKNIKNNTDIELEVFIHGALCYSYSGMCFYSSLIGGRSGNRGRCAQPCRMSYNIKGIDKDWLSLKDLSALDNLYDLCLLGINSLKIEGRMKSKEYAAGVTSIYRKYLDLIKANKKVKIEEKDREFLYKLFQRRGFMDGYLNRHNGPEMLINEESRKYEEALAKDIYIEKKIPLKFNAYFHQDSNAVLVVEDEKNNIVTVDGDLCLKATNKPLDKETVIDKLSRLNDTFFIIDSIYVDIGSEVFLPLSALNNLRRNAINEYKKLIDDYYKRDIPPRIELINKSAECITNTQSYSASFLNEKQGYAICDCDKIKRIYFPADLYFKNKKDSLDLINLFKKKQKTVFLSMPEIFRQKTKKLFLDSSNEILNAFDGFLLKNFDELHFFKSNYPNACCVLDFTIYSFNQNAGNVLKSYYSNLTAPIELNYHELKHLNLTDSELIIYGRYPMMFTANCLKKNSDKCTFNSDSLYYKDRKGIKFFVKTMCSFCCNIIYNSKPSSLFGEMEKVKELNFSLLRYSFTDETSDEVIDIINASIEPKDFTKGHFIRGVE